MVGKKNKGRIFRFYGGEIGLSVSYFLFNTPEKQNNLNLIEKGGGEGKIKKCRLA